MVDVESIRFALEGWEDKWVRPQAPGGFATIASVDSDVEVIPTTMLEPPFYLWGATFFWGDVYLSFIIDEQKPKDPFQRVAFDAYPKYVVEDWGSDLPDKDIPYIRRYSRVAGTSIPGPTQPLFAGVVPMIVGQYIPRPPDLFTYQTRILARLRTTDPFTLGVGSTQTNTVCSILAYIETITDVDLYIKSIQKVESKYGESVTFKGRPLINQLVH